MKPDVQIAISVYKQKFEYIKECVQSAINQSHEGVLVTLRTDGPSACDTEVMQWLEELSRSRKDFRFEDGCQHLGIYGSYNKLFQKTRLPFILHLDADDRLDHFAIEVLRDSLIMNDKAVLSFANCIETSADSKPTRERRPSSKSQAELGLLVEFYCFHPRLIRRNAFAKANSYSTEFKMIADYDLCLKLNELGEMCHVDLPLYYYRVHEESATHRNLGIVFRESSKAVQNALLRRGLDNTYRAHVDTQTGAIRLLHRGIGKVFDDITYIAPAEMHSRVTDQE